MPVAADHAPSAATCSASRRTRSTFRPARARNFVVPPAPAAQLGEQGRVRTHVPEAVGQLVDAVEVAADPDVLDAGDLADVVHVVGHLAERGVRAGRSARHRRRAGDGGRVPGVSAPPAALERGELEPGRALGCETNPGTNATMHTPPLRGSSREDVVGHVAGMVAERARAGVAEDDGALVAASAARIVAGATCERSTSMPSRFISCTTWTPNAVSPPCRASSVAESAHGCCGCGSGSCSGRRAEHHPQRAQRAADAVAALDSEHRRDPARRGRRARRRRRSGPGRGRPGTGRGVGGSRRAARASP